MTSMTSTTDMTSLKELCAVFSRAQHEDPAGMASGAGRYVLMELAPPWARDLRQSRHFPPALRAILEAARERELHRTTRFHCLAPDPDYSAPGLTRFLYFRRPPDLAAAFEKQEFLVPEGEAVRLAQALIEQPDDLSAFDAYRQSSAHIRDILVCTHGSVDACCAKFGYPLYNLLRERHAAPSGGRLRAWRVSHFGGHRLAPTLIDFPEGRYWGHVTATALDGLVRRHVPVAALRRCYRGWGGLPTRFEQIAEREVFIREGWPWTGYRKAGRVLEVAAGGARAVVRIDYAAPGGHPAGAYEATVELSGTVPYVHCREAGEPGEMKQYHVTHLVNLAPAPAA